MAYLDGPAENLLEPCGQHAVRPRRSAQRLSSTPLTIRIAAPKVRAAVTRRNCVRFMES